MSNYRVIIKATKRGDPLQYKFSLWKMGFRRNGEEYVSYVKTARKIKKIQKFADKRHLNFRIDNQYGSRSASYRQVFFSTHPPDLFGRYFCAYCGTLIPRGKVTVDHLYPVGKSSRSLRMQKKLKRKGIEDINSPKNLVAACGSCNRKKGMNMGGWITRGKLGRHTLIWCIRWAVRWVMIGTIATLIVWMILRFIGLA